MFSANSECSASDSWQRVAERLGLKYYMQQLKFLNILQVFQAHCNVNAAVFFFLGKWIVLPKTCVSFLYLEKSNTQEMCVF